MMYMYIFVVHSLSSVRLCDPMDCILPGSSVHGILQARILEQVAMSSFRGSPDSWIKSGSPALQADSSPSELPGKTQYKQTNVKYILTVGFVFLTGYEVHGMEKIPEEGPALIIFYHGAIPIDFYYFMAKIFIHKGRTCRVVADHFVFKIPGKLSLQLVIEEYLMNTTNYVTVCVSLSSLLIVLHGKSCCLFRVVHLELQFGSICFR